MSLLAFVLPNVVNQFIKAGADLPLITKILLGISNNIGIILILSFIVCAGLYFLYLNAVKDLNKKILIDKKILSIPLIGNFILNSELERFSSTMELLISSGANLDIALDECSKIFNNKYLSSIILKAKDDVFEGKDFIKSLQQESIFPDIFTQLISSGYKLSLIHI